MDNSNQGNIWILLVFWIIIGTQVLKFYLNLFVGKQFYPHAFSYNDEMKKIGKDGNDEIGKLSRHDQDFMRKERKIDGAILYPRYIYFLIPFWLELPKTKKGKTAGHAVFILSLLQLFLIITAYLYNS